MKGYHFRSLPLASVLLAFFLVTNPAWSNQKQATPAGKGVAGGDVAEEGQKKAIKKEGTKKEKEKSVAFPIYKPPMRGAPAGRVGGGTRGAGGKYPQVCVLAPDHVGFTVRDQPCFYWYLSSLTDYPIEFTLIENRAINPALEKRIPCPAAPGIQKITPADLGDVRLKRGYKYKWYIAVILDEDHRSKDIISGAEIELVSPGESLRARLNSASKGMLPALYAEEGLWYDAIEAISTLIETNPGDSDLKAMRDSLLEQVGLKGVAGSDKE
jgi:hypothetical protein